MILSKKLLHDTAFVAIFFVATSSLLSVVVFVDAQQQEQQLSLADLTYQHLVEITKDVDGHPNPRLTCTEGHAYAAQYVSSQMERIGIIPLGDAGRTTYDNIVPNSIHADLCPYGIRNIIGMVEGTTYPDEYIIYSAHLDGPNNQNPQTQTTRGNQDTSNAYDDGTAVALGLAMAEYFITDNPPPARSIIFLFDDGEEGFNNVGIPPIGQSDICDDLMSSGYMNQMPVTIASLGVQPEEEEEGGRGGGGCNSASDCSVGACNFPIGANSWVQNPTVNLLNVKAAFFADPLGAPPNGEASIVAIGGEMSTFTGEEEEGQVNTGSSKNMNDFLTTVWPSDSSIQLLKAPRKAVQENYSSIDGLTTTYVSLCSSNCAASGGFPSVWLSQVSMQKYRE